MKSKCLLWLLLFSLMACGASYGQEASSTPQPSKDTLPQEDTAEAGTAYREAKQPQAWEEVRQQFLQDCLGPFLREKQVVPDCSTCDRILFSYALKADGKGHIAEARQLSCEISCTRLKAKDIKALNARIRAYFEKLRLPPALYNSSYKGPFSIMLRC